MDIAVFGAGGHAKVVISAIRAAGFTASVVYDDAPERAGGWLLDVPIRSMADAVERHPTNAVLAIGSNTVRQHLDGRFPHTSWVTIVHPRAFVDCSVKLGEGTVVFAGAVIQPDTIIGRHVIINTGATVDHDCIVQDFVHIAPGSNLAGGVRIGSRAFLGIGSSVVPGVELGDDIVLGAGTVVIRSITKPGTYIGAPARSVG